jgi:hypothetical protein
LLQIEGEGRVGEGLLKLAAAHDAEFPCPRRSAGFIAELGHHLVEVGAADHFVTCDDRPLAGLFTRAGDTLARVLRIFVLHQHMLHVHRIGLARSRFANHVGELDAATFSGDRARLRQRRARVGRAATSGQHDERHGKQPMTPNTLDLGNSDHANLS